MGDVLHRRNHGRLLVELRFTGQLAFRLFIIELGHVRRNAAGTQGQAPTPTPTPTPQQPDQAPQDANIPTGMQVALQAQGLQAPMVKSFLLGEP